MQHHHQQYFSSMTLTYASSAYLSISVLLAGVPGSGARGGKGAKGAGGGVSGYGHRGLHNAAAYEMTWEDIVLAMQLSGMCFGALLALCIVACCAYKICGPAEEEDWNRRYRTSSFKPVSTRFTSELLREIYTVPTNTLSSANQTASDKKDIPPPTPPISSNPNIQRHTLSEGSILGTAVSNDHTIQQQQQRPLPPPPPVNLPNGRAIMEETMRGGSMMSGVSGGGGGGVGVTGSTGGTSGCLSLGAVLDHRPRGVTMSSLSTSRLLTEARRPGVAPRLAAHLNNSTLDLTHPHQQYIATFAPLHNSTRSLSEPQTAIV